MTKQLLEAEQLSAIAIQGLQELKGQDIVLMDLRELDAAVTDYFVIATGTSDRHVTSLADSVLMMMKKEAEEIPISKEGMQTGEWVLIDYGSVVIHIFQRDKRDFYRLESLWGDAEVEKVGEN